MMKAITTVLGAVLCLTAIIGFFNHSFMNMDLNPAHDLMLLILGGIALYFAFMGTEFQARYTCRVLGILFALLGIATLLAGHGIARAGGVNIVAEHVLKLVPRHLEYTTADGVRDLLMGIIGIVAGFLPRQAEIIVDMKAKSPKEKIGTTR